MNEHNPSMVFNIEGNDGTGKGTLSRKLESFLRYIGFHPHIVDLPDYSLESGKLVKAFLNGEFFKVPPQDVDPITASLLYTLNRHEHYQEHPELATDYDVLIFNRSYLSNYFYQFSKYLYSKGSIRTSDIHVMQNWMNAQFALEINATFLSDIPIQNIHNYYITTESVSANMETIEKTRESVDLLEQDLSYLESIEAFAKAIHGASVSDSPIIQQYYDFTLLNMKRGSTEEEIEKYQIEVISHMLMTAGFPLDKCAENVIADAFAAMKAGES